MNYLDEGSLAPDFTEVDDCGTRQTSKIANKIKIRRSPKLSSEIPLSTGTNSTNVIDSRPIMMYRAYCVTIPESCLAICCPPACNVFVSPNGPNNSIAPRSRTLAVTNPRPRDLLIT
jgi:hypothetical protein